MAKWRRKLSNTIRWNRDQLITKFGAKCGICGIDFNNMKEITIDHIVPESISGMDVLENLQLAHLSCNGKKDNMTGWEYEIWKECGVFTFIKENE